MAIGARDYIDRLLVKKYANEQVDNHDSIENVVDAEKMLEVMNDVAAIQRNMFVMSEKLYNTCYAFNARAARYKKAANV